MKNKMNDVRDHLVAMLEALGDTSADATTDPQLIERAKATAMVAGTYIAAVKTELDAIQLFDRTGCLPAAIEAPPASAAPRKIAHVGSRA